MATINLNPDSTVANNWVVIRGGTAHEELADTNTSSGIRDNAQNQDCTVELNDLGASLTATAVISSIRYYISGYLYNTRSGDTEVQVKLQNSSGSDLYSENHQLLFNSYVPQDFYGTARTTSDGSTAWTTSDINGLRLNINTSPEDPPGGSYANVVKAYVEVTYTVPAADNAILFGTNF